MKFKFLQNVFTFISGLSLVLQSLAPALALGSLTLNPVYAQDATPTASPTPTDTLAPTDTTTPTPTDSIAPTATSSPTGATGVTGDTGASTEVGPSADTGSTGVTGDTGSSSELSPTGATGSSSDILDGISTTSTDINPTDMTNPNPNGDQGQTGQTNSSINTQPPTDTLTPAPAVIPAPSPDVQGQLGASVVKNTKADTLNLDYSNITTSATLTTNKGDYAPTDTVVVTGTEFLPKHNYSLEISSTDPPAVDFSTGITTNEQGSFVYAYQLDGNYRPNYKVEVKLADSVIATTTFTDSPTLTTQVLSWNTIGLDSNKPVTDGPHQFVIQARITNPGPQSATNVNVNFTLGSGTSYISTVGSVSQSLGTLTSGQTKDVFFQVLITPPGSPNNPSNAAFGKTRNYTITTSYDGNPPVIFNSTLTIEKLNSQNRNHIISTVISPTSIHTGDTFTVTVNSSSSTVFDNISVPMSFNPTIAQMSGDVTTYSSPADTENDFYALNEGNNIQSVFTFKALAPGTSNFFWLIYDKSGGSYHYNSDFGQAIVITVEPQLSITKTPS